jgi:hypothetical protein
MNELKRRDQAFRVSKKDIFTPADRDEPAVVRAISGWKILEGRELFAIAAINEADRDIQAGRISRMFGSVDEMLEGLKATPR